MKAAARLTSFAVTVLFLSLTLVGAQVPDQSIRKNSDGTECGPEGTARTSDGRSLDRKKNRFDIPKSDQIDSTISLAQLLAPGDDVDRFDDKVAAKLVGLVVDVKVG